MVQITKNMSGISISHYMGEIAIGEVKGRFSSLEELVNSKRCVFPQKGEDSELGKCQWGIAHIGKKNALQSILTYPEFTSEQMCAYQDSETGEYILASYKIIS